MKEIFEVIFWILSHIIHSSSIYSKAAHENLEKLGKLIEDFEEEGPSELRS